MAVLANAMASTSPSLAMFQSRKAAPESSCSLVRHAGSSGSLGRSPAGPRRSVSSLPFLTLSSAPRCRRISASLSGTTSEKFNESSSSANGGVRFSANFFRLLALATVRVGQMGDAVRDAVQKPQTREEAQLLNALKGRMACAAAPVLFAAVSQSVNTPLTVVASGMAKWLELYSGVLMVRVLLSWFPNIPWERQPLQAMRDMCDPYLNLFRNIIPPLFNALDLSPMLAFLVLGVLTSILNTTVQAT